MRSVQSLRVEVDDGQSLMLWRDCESISVHEALRILECIAATSRVLLMTIPYGAELSELEAHWVDDGEAST